MERKVSPPLAERAATKRLQQLAKEKKVEQVADFLNSMEKSLTEVNIFHYSAALGVHHRWLEAFQFLKEIGLRSVKFHAITMNIAMRTLDEWSLALVLCRHMETLKLSQEESTFNAVMTSGMTWDLAMCTFLSMIHVSLRPDTTSLNVALKTMDTWPNAVALSLPSVERDLISLNTILNCCEEWNISIQFLQTARGRNTVDMISYTTAMTAFTPVTLWMRTLCLLMEMPKTRTIKVSRGLIPGGPSPLIQPNLVTWNTALATGHWKLTLELFKHSQSEGICPDIVTFSTAAASAEWHWAVQLLRSMCLQRISSDDVTSLAMISSLERSFRWKDAISSLSRRNDNAGPSGSLFGAAINACGAASQWQFGVAFLELMEEHDVGHLLGVLMALEDLDWQVALSLLEKVRALESEESQMVCCNSILSTCSRAVMWRQIHQLLDAMQRGRIRSNEMSFNVAMKSFNWEMSLEIFEGMRVCGLRHDLTSFNSMIDVAKVWRLALGRLKDMKALKLQHDLITLVSVMDATSGTSITENQWQKGIQVLEETQEVADKNVIAVNSVLKSLATPWTLVLQLLHERHVQVDVMSFNACLRATSIWYRAFATFQLMPQRGIRVDEISLEALTMAMMTARDVAWDMALKVFSENGGVSRAMASARSVQRCLGRPVVLQLLEDLELESSTLLRSTLKHLR